MIPDKMDTDIGREKLRELRVEDRIVRANDRAIERFEIDPRSGSRETAAMETRLASRARVVVSIRKHIDGHRRPGYLADFLP